MTIYMLINLAAFALSIAIFFTARVYPLRLQRGRGCDAYFFLMCATVLREGFRLPVTLPPSYLAEDREQWYPPLFAVFLAALPPAWLRANHWLVNQLLDFMIAATLFVLVLPWLGAWGAIALVGMYAIQPALIQEFATLTSRPLGMLIQLVVIAASYNFVAESSQLSGILAVVGVATLVYAHKLSLQLLWFLFPFLSIVTGSWEWIAILAGGYGLAAMVWPSMFVKIMRAHWDIVRFWSREWPLLGAHPVRESPIYGGGENSTAYYRSSSIRSSGAFLKTILQINVFAVFLALPFFIPMPTLPMATFFWWWAAGIYIWVACTHFIPYLRCLGLAQQYVKFGYVPVFAFTAMYLSDASLLALVLAAFCAVPLVRWYMLTTRSLRAPPVIPQSGNVTNLVEFLNGQVAPRIMVFPYHLYDELAYRTKAKVLWGTHGYGFDRVRPFFPVLREPLASIVDTYKLTHIVIDSDYVAPHELGISTMAEGVEHIGRFWLIDAAKLDVVTTCVPLVGLGEKR